MNDSPRRSLASAAPFAAVALAAAAALAAPFAGFPTDIGGAAPAADQTTVWITTPETGGEAELKLDGLQPGESRTLTTASGKPVVVTREGDVLHVKIADRTIDVPYGSEKSLQVVAADGSAHGHKFVRVQTSGDPAGCKDGLTPDGQKCVVKKIVMVNDGSTVVTGDGPPTAKSLLESKKPASYAGLDARTKEAVEKVLQELIDNGGFHGGYHFVTTNGESAGTGEEVRVKVIRQVDAPGK